MVPAVLVAGLFLLIGTLFAVPIIGGIVGAGLFFVLLLESAPLVVGAVLGGALAE
jgi:hypothetical protein